MESKDTNLTTSQLRAVSAVARCGSFVAAASALGWSQSSLSRIVQNTEEVVGMPLFSRSTRRVELTDAGLEFVEMADRVLGDVALALRNMEDLAALRRGQLIVSSLQSFAIGTLSSVVATYADSFKGIEIRLREGVQQAVEQDVQSGVADVGICAIDSIDRAQFAVEPLGEERFHLILPKKSSKRTWGDQVDLRALSGKRMLSLPEGSTTRTLIDSAFSAAGVVLDSSVVTSSFATIISLVRCGAGLAIVPAGIVDSARDAGLTSVPMAEKSLVRTLGIVRLANRNSSPALEEFLRCLKSADARRAAHK